ncbi:MAG TPA: enoyl-CoA hydratase-related protein [Candidatus Eisenbacteria bacterium]|jgi:enoyl-CoA hydratase/carnithine racemase
MRHYGSRPAGALGLTEVLYEKRDAVARITLNRPQRYNAYSTRALEELTAALRDAAFDDAVGVIVFTGAGDRAFCTGGDVKEYAEEYVQRPRDYWKYMSQFRAYLEAIVESGKPTIARINGMAVGGGNESQLACDLSVMAEHAVLRQVGTHVGSVACGGATQWLSLNVGDKRAREMLMLNRPVPARQALAWGLVNRVSPSVTRHGAFFEGASDEQIRMALEGKDGYGLSLERLDRDVDELAGALLESFAECTRYTKEQANFLKNFVWHSTIGHAREWLALHYACAEPLEGMNAFVEKRKPRYRDLRERAARDRSPETPWGAFVRHCPSCGTRGLPDRFEYCGQCGAALAAPVAARE